VALKFFFFLARHLSVVGVVSLPTHNPTILNFFGATTSPVVNDNL
jgi:hypothetical protein